MIANIKAAGFPAGVRVAAKRAAACLLVGLCCLSLLAGPAAAAFDGPVAVDIRSAGDADNARVIVSFDRPVSANHQLLDHPQRLVLDFERIGYGFDPASLGEGELVRAFRFGDMSDTASRMIFEIGSPFVVREINATSDAGLHQLVIDIARADDTAFRRAITDQVQTASVVRQEAKRDRLGANVTDARSQFVVVLDAGHGGIDSGAIGKAGTREKDVTLAFSKELRAALAAHPGVKVVMTRDKDTFIPLDDRVCTGRQANASLFVSIHADSVRQNFVRGATVYTISEKASDAVAAEIATSENSSDAIAGITYEDTEPAVADILVDLARQETLGFSVQFARLAVSRIASAARMIKNPHRHAGFRVLKAPDVPSVLVELGYLSNADDEKLLTDPKWRHDVAVELAQSIADFAELSGHVVAQSDGN